MLGEDLVLNASFVEVHHHYLVRCHRYMQVLVLDDGHRLVFDGDLVFLPDDEQALVLELWVLHE